MPRYLQTNADGYCTITGTIPPGRAAGRTEYTGQALPCWPTGEPVTLQEVADIAEAKRLARLERLRAPIEDILAALDESAIERPADFRDARAKLRAMGNRQAANTAGIELLAARVELLELGGTWEDVGAFAAAQAAGELP